MYMNMHIKYFTDILLFSLLYSCSYEVSLMHGEIA